MSHHNTADDIYIHETFLALTSGNQRAARRWAEQSIRLMPQQEEAWVILGLLAAPQAGVYYMRRALQINPKSKKAQAGLRWALDRYTNSKEGRRPVPGNRQAQAGSGFSRSLSNPMRKMGLLLSALLLILVGLSMGAYEKAEAATGLPAPGPDVNTQSTSSSKEVSAINTEQITTASSGEDSTSTTAATASEEPAPNLLPAPTATPPPDNPALVQEIIPAASASPAVTAAPTQVLLTGPKSIVVSLSQQRLFAYQGNALVFRFIVSTGQGGGTAVGNFQILDKISDAFSEPWGFWMPYWMGIYYATPFLENGFHALPVLPNGHTIWGDALGTPVSYGCVVLGTQDAQQLFAWTDIGTQVTIQH
jgi:lipoprotein-anchoring transpeptidase ErfK/SrfK